ncbi:MAG: GNAT family N-acetyltransferase [Clostridiales bacterium]|nr:GNAT family N-acetyltransferase [Clostridiales bacterium]
MEPIIDIIPAQTQNELERCFAVRRAVFCVERGVSPAIERDGWDTLSPDCAHFLIQEGVADIGALRCRYADGAAIIQRFCVLKERRKSGVGRAALEAVEDWCRAAGIRRMELDAKFEVHGFYEKCGYAKISAPFEEAGIPLVKMAKELF